MKFKKIMCVVMPAKYYRNVFILRSYNNCLEMKIFEFTFVPKIRISLS